MLNVIDMKQVSVIGGGTAGWFAALTLRSMFAKNIEVVVIESPKIGIVGVGVGVGGRRPAEPDPHAEAAEYSGRRIRPRDGRRVQARLRLRRLARRQRERSLLSHVR